MDTNKDEAKIHKGCKSIHAAECAMLITLAAVFILRVPVFVKAGMDGSGIFGIGTDLFMLIYMSFGVSICCVIRDSVSGSIRKKQFRNVCKNVKAGMFVSAACSAVICVTLVALSGWISSVLLCEPRAQLVILACVPAAVCTVISGTAKGYIRGCRFNSLYVAGHIAEAVLLIAMSVLGTRIGVSIGTKAAALLVNKDIVFIYGAAGAMAGISAAELICMVYWIALLVVFYRPMSVLAGDDNSTGGGSLTDIMKQLMSRQLPYLLLGAMVGSYFPLTMRFYFGSAPQKTDYLGMWGEYFTFWGVAAGIAVVICCADISGAAGCLMRAQARDEQNRMNKILNNAVRHMLATGIPAAAFISVLGNNIALAAGVKDKSHLAAVFTVYSCVVILSALCLFFGMVLIRKDYISELLICTAIAYVVSVIAAASFISGMKSIAGAAAGMLIFTAMDTAMLGTILRRKMGMRIRFMEYSFKVVSAGAVYLVMIIILKHIMISFTDDLVTVLVCFAVGSLFYIYLLTAMHVLPDRQLKSIPFGDLMLVLFRGTEEKIEK